MSLSKTIQNLRQKPEGVRQRILLITMVIIAVIVFAFWIFIFRFERSSVQGSSSTVNFFKSIGGSISKTVQDISQ
jgi:hypothetical protein